MQHWIRYENMAIDQQGGVSEDIIEGFFTNYCIDWTLNKMWKACE